MTKGKKRLFFMKGYVQSSICMPMRCRYRKTALYNPSVFSQTPLLFLLSHSIPPQRLYCSSSTADWRLRNGWMAECEGGWKRAESLFMQAKKVSPRQEKGKKSQIEPHLTSTQHVRLEGPFQRGLKLFLSIHHCILNRTPLSERVKASFVVFIIW